MTESAPSGAAAAPTHDRSGLWAALFAYGVWGAFPLFFQLTRAVGLLEVVAHRVLWSAAVLVVLLALRRRLGGLRRWLRPAVVGPLAVAALLLATNWGVYVWAVTHGHTVDASLGYFLNPLLSVALAVLLLGERLPALQWGGVACASAGVLWLAWVSPQFPWVSLALAASFALYGLIKKRVTLPAMEGMLVETGVLLPLALALLAWLAGQGTLAFGHGARLTDAALLASGLVTTLPLVAFATAAQRLPLAMLGMLQYIAPTLQFAIGVGVLHETMDLRRLAGFAAVWLGLALFTLAGLRRPRPGAG